MFARFLGVLPILLFLQPVVSFAAAVDTVVPQTCTYVHRDGKPLLLDVYRPVVPRDDSACVVYLFGGGFVNGSRTEASVRSYCQSLARRGFVAVAIDYRLHLAAVNADTVRLGNVQRIFRDAINIAASDAAAAVAHLCRNANRYGIATNRIVLCGGSAGAISVLQLDYCRANSLPPALELPLGFRPAAVVAYAGAVYADYGRPKYLSAPAPTFFLHGDADKIVNYRRFPPLIPSANYGAKRLHRIFHRNGYPHWFFTFKGIGHEVASLHNYTIEEFVAFVDATLRGRNMSYDAKVSDSLVVPTEWTKMNVFDLYRK